MGIISGFNVGVAVSLGDVGLALDVLREAEEKENKTIGEHGVIDLKVYTAEKEEADRREELERQEQEENDRLEEKRLEKEKEEAKAESARLDKLEAERQARINEERKNERRRQEEKSNKEEAARKESERQQAELKAAQERARIAERELANRIAIEKAELSAVKQTQAVNGNELGVKEYSMMKIDALYNEVREYMSTKGVDKKAVSKAELANKFGAENINKLLIKSYLIALGNFVTIGR